MITLESIKVLNFEPEPVSLISALILCIHDTSVYIFMHCKGQKNRLNFVSTIEKKYKKKHVKID